ncbi:Smad nuclear interacting protein-like protein [Phycomyces blakesleeanus]|uniref:Smad nuclear interacting protein-like protein n=1 Tax=Phycomyces blakesleeanus TaxID=4837 RepID=A0ABR3B147_PHYBL
MSSPHQKIRSQHRSRSRSPRYRNSRSPPRLRESRQTSRSRSRSPVRRSSHQRRNSNDRQDRRPERGGGGRGRKYEWGRSGDNESREEKEEPVQEKQEPNFGLSGKLASETNTLKGVELKYNEPPEAAKPKQQWRFYVFKGDEQIELLHIHRQSAFLIGRDRVVVDIPVDHPSCSKQHAVLQFRRVAESDPKSNNVRHVVKPFVIDLESTNGTFLNGTRIPSTRYVELRLKDVLKFGNSTREYVLLHSEAGGELSSS